MVGEQLILPEMPATPGAKCQMPASCCASGNGSGLIRTPSITLKIAVLAPMPSARVTRAIDVNIGDRPNRRRTCRRALMETNTCQMEFGFAKKPVTGSDFFVSSYLDGFGATTDGARSISGATLAETWRPK